MRDLARRAIGEKAILDAAKGLHDETRAALAEAIRTQGRSGFHGASIRSAIARC